MNCYCKYKDGEVISLCGAHANYERPLWAAIKAANDLSQFIATNEYPMISSNGFHRLTELADAQDTAVRAVLGIKGKRT